MQLTLAALALVVAAVILVTPVQSQDTSDTKETDSSQNVTRNATYVITMSNKFRLGTDLEVSVQMLKEPVILTVSITFQTYQLNSTAKTLLTSDPFSVLPGEPQVFKVNIPYDLEVPEERWSGRFGVILVGQGQTVNFKHEGYINLEEKSFSVFIATDKPKYRPGETVKFRVLAVRPKSLEAVVEPMDITITDSKGNKILQFLGIKGKDTQGVVQESFKLAKSTPVGDWTITVDMLRLKKETTFKVEYFKLPRFNVEVQTPPIPLSTTPVLKIKVLSKYTFNKPVTVGKVDVRVTLYQPWIPFGTNQNVSEIRRSGTLNSDGEFEFELSPKQFTEMVIKTYSYSELTYQQFSVVANVTEGSTQVVQTGSSIMKFYQSPVKAQFTATTPNTFKPNLPYNGILEVTKADDTRLSQEEASNVKVRFNVTYEVPISKEEQAAMENSTSSSSSNSSDAKFRSDGFAFWPRNPTRTYVLELESPVKTVPESGFVFFSFTVPTEAISAIIIATLDKPYGSSDIYYYISKSESPSNSYLQSSAPSTTPKIGDTITLKVAATEPVKELTCQIFSKDLLVLQKTVTSPTPEGSKYLEFSVEVTKSWFPSVNIGLFYIRKENSEIVVDVLSLLVDGLFQKSVSIAFNKEKVKPGEPVDVTIKAEPDSHVFYEVHDYSLELISPNYGITQDKIRYDLAEYMYGMNPSWIRYMFICGGPSYYGATDAASAFSRIDLNVFSDGLVYRKQYYYDFVPMAMPGEAVVDDKAASNRGSSSGLTTPERVRKEFPESWIWAYEHVSSTGEVVIPYTAPDTITSWSSTIFSLHPASGLSVGSNSPKLITARDLFVYLDLPNYIIRNESFCFVVTLFSYYPGKIPVLLTFDRSDDYNAVYIRRDGETATPFCENMASSEFHADVAENEIRSSKFCFTPIVVGDILLKVSALTNIQGLSDAVEQVITVKAEGVARSSNIPTLLNLTTGFEKKEVEIKFPSDIVPDSQSITVSISGNVIGSISENLNKLLRQPNGCGEQNMLNFAPAISFLEFRIATGTITPEIFKQAKDYILLGYQTELTYEHNKTGGFSAFGDNDRIGSTWLTAFVLEVFSSMAIVNTKQNNSLGIDPTDAIIRSANFICSNQNLNGSFTEYGVVFHKEMQGGSAQGEALTAYLMIALSKSLEAVKNNAAFTEKIQSAIDLAAKYLVSRIPYLSDPFDICITTYALTLVNDPSKDLIFAKMQEISKKGDGLKFWARPKSAQEVYPTYAWTASSDSISIEATSYALLVYCLRNIETTEGLPVIRWLTNQRGPNSGFISTQDTVKALGALSRASIQLYPKENIPFTVTISYIDGDGKSQSHIAKINKDNELLLQKFEIPYKNNAPSILAITANTDSGRPGPSTAFADVAQEYNVKGEATAHCFELSHVLNTTEAGITLKIKIVALKENTSMTLLDVEIPSGYTVDKDRVKDNNENISLTEVNGDVLTIYYNTGVIDKTGKSVTIQMDKTSGSLTKAESRSYRCYDYYQKKCSETKLYQWEVGPFCKEASDYGVCPYI